MLSIFSCNQKISNSYVKNREQLFFTAANIGFFVGGLLLGISVPGSLYPNTILFGIGIGIGTSALIDIIVFGVKTHNSQKKQSQSRTTFPTDSASRLSGSRSSEIVAGSLGSSSSAIATGPSGSSASAIAIGASGSSSSAIAIGPSGSSVPAIATGASGSSSSAIAIGPSGSSVSAIATGASGSSSSALAIGPSGSSASAIATGPSGSSASAKATGSSGSSFSTAAWDDGVWKDEWANEPYKLVVHNNPVSPYRPLVSSDLIQTTHDSYDVWKVLTTACHLDDRDMIELCLNSKSMRESAGLYLIYRHYYPDPAVGEFIMSQRTFEQVRALFNHSNSSQMYTSLAFAAIRNENNAVFQWLFTHKRSLLDFDFIDHNETLLGTAFSNRCFAIISSLGMPRGNPSVYFYLSISIPNRMHRRGAMAFIEAEKWALKGRYNSDGILMWSKQKEEEYQAYRKIRSFT